VEIEVRAPDEVGPLRAGTTATVRGGHGRTSLALRPGPDDGPILRDGATIDAGPAPPAAGAATTADPTDRTDRRGPTGRAAAALGRAARRARGADAPLDAVADEARRLRRALAGVARIADAVDGERAALRRVLVRGGRLVDDLRDGGAAIDAALDRAPRVTRRAAPALAGVRGLLDDFDPMLGHLGAAIGPLRAVRRSLRPALRDAGPAIAALRRVIRDPGKGDDLLDLLARGPRAARTLAPAVAETTRALAGMRPIVAFLRPYAPDLAGAVRNAGDLAAGYDANGHLARVQPLVDADAATASPLLRGPVAGLRDARGDEAAPTSAPRRCPGAASAPRPDRSNPFRDADGRLDCAPEPEVPGP